MLWLNMLFGVFLSGFLQVGDEFQIVHFSGPRYKFLGWRHVKRFVVRNVSKFLFALGKQRRRVYNLWREESGSDLKIDLTNVCRTASIRTERNRLAVGRPAWPAIECRIL